MYEEKSTPYFLEGEDNPFNHLYEFSAVYVIERHEKNFIQHLLNLKGTIYMEYVEVTHVKSKSKMSFSHMKSHDEMIDSFVWHLTNIGYYAPPEPDVVDRIIGTFGDKTDNGNRWSFVVSPILVNSIGMTSYETVEAIDSHTTQRFTFCHYIGARVGQYEMKSPTGLLKKDAERLCEAIMNHIKSVNTFNSALEEKKLYNSLENLYKVN